MEERLQKLLAAAGLASRRKAEAWLRAGRVTVNGELAALGDRADPERDDVRVDGEPLVREPAVYWILHKPKGILTTVADPHAAESGRRTVMEILPARARRVRLYPVGRLDADSEGLLLLTNDGAVAQAMLHPSLGTDKEYRVTVRGALSEDALARLRTGIVLDDGPTAPCQVSRVRHDVRTGLTGVTLTLREGRKRQIRRAMERLGHPVVRLVRVRMGPLELRGLKSGEARPLDAAERNAVRRRAERSAPTQRPAKSRTQPRATPSRGPRRHPRKPR